MLTAARSHPAKVDLLFEGVDLFNLNLDEVSQLDDASTSTPDELDAGRVELVEVVVDSRKRHHTADSDIGDVDEESKVPHIGDQRLIGMRRFGIQLLFQIGIHFDVLAVAFGIGRISLGRRDMFCGLDELRDSHLLVVKKTAMNDEVGIPSDWGGEVTVFFLGQSVVSEGFDRVAGAHQGAEKADLQGCPDRERAKAFEQLLHFSCFLEISAGEIVTENFFSIVLQSLGVGALVNTIDRGFPHLHEPSCDRLIGEKHEFFDELMRFVVVDLFDAGDASFVIESDLGLREIEIERTVRETPLANLHCDRASVFQHLLGFILCGAFGLKHFEGLLVAVASLRVNDSRVKLGAKDLAAVIDEKLDTFGKSVDVRLERAKLVAQSFRKHGNDSIDEVGRVSSVMSLLVQGRAGFHIVRDVGDVHPEFPSILGRTGQGKGIVEILGIRWVDRDDVVVSTVDPTLPILGGYLFAIFLHLLEDGPWKLQREIVLAKHGKHVDAFRGGRSENFGDHSLGIDVSRFPTGQLDHDLVTDSGRSAGVFCRRDVDVLLETGIVGNDVEKLLTLFQRADELGAPALKDADDFASLVFFFLLPFPLRFSFETNEDAVIVHRGAGLVGRDGDFSLSRGIREEKSAATPGDLDSSWNEIGLPGQDIAISLDACDLAGALEFFENGLEFLLLAALETELFQKFRNVGGQISFPPHQS